MHAPVQYLIATDEYVCKCGERWPWDHGMAMAFRNHLRAVLDLEGQNLSHEDLKKRYLECPGDCVSQYDHLEVSPVALAAYGRRKALYYRYGIPLPWYLILSGVLRLRIESFRVWLSLKIYRWDKYS